MPPTVVVGVEAAMRVGVRVAALLPTVRVEVGVVVVPLAAKVVAGAVVAPPAVVPVLSLPAQGPPLSLPMPPLLLALSPSLGAGVVMVGVVGQVRVAVMLLSPPFATTWLLPLSS